MNGWKWCLAAYIVAVSLFAWRWKRVEEWRRFKAALDELADSALTTAALFKALAEEVRRTGVAMGEVSARLFVQRDDRWCDAGEVESAEIRWTPDPF